MIAAIASGESRLYRFATGQDCRSTLGCLRRLGIEIREEPEVVTITGQGLHGLRRPAGPLDAGNSGTTMRLLAGILAGQPFESILSGDVSLSRRPMERIITPLRLMGASIVAAPGGFPPLSIRGGGLHGLRYELPVASAQVKSCVLLAGLYAAGETAVREATPTRAHTEIALREFGVSVREEDGWIVLRTSPLLQPRDLEVPADLSSASFFVAATLLVPGSRLLLRRVGLAPGRKGLLQYLQQAGAEIRLEHEEVIAGEPRGDVRIAHNPAFLKQKLPPLGGGAVAALIDEIPALAVLASRTEGGLEVRGARELRFKESDRISALAQNLQAMGARVEELPDGLRIGGGRPLSGCDIHPHGDHRIAMAFAVGALSARGETRIHDAECVDISFPGFWEILASVSTGGVA